MTSLIRWALAFCLLLFVIGAGMAQNTNSGDIRGTVTDSTGAVLAGVKVTVTNIDTGSSKVLSTNNDGLYDTASILPGNYQITFTKDGFQRLVRGPVNLQVGIITVDGPMKVGAISEQVTVTTEAPLLKTETAEQSTTFDSQTMLNLPQVSTSGQNWGTFAQLLPGASGAVGMPTATGDAGDPGIAVAVNGNLPFYDNFLQDGASTNLPISQNVDIATFETISELQVSTSTFSAEYGIGGAVFNQITKSGSNRFHGAAYEYFGADWLKADSYNFSSTPQPKPFLRYDNYGGAVGGPIIKGKLFFYFNVDKIYDKGGGATQSATVPTAAMRAGDFTGMPTIYDPATPIVGGSRTSFTSETGKNAIPASRFDSVANALQAYYPAPNTPGQIPNAAFPGLVINNYNYSSPNLNPFLKYFGRIDYNMSEKNRLNFSITQRDNPGTNTNFQVCPIDCFSGDVDSYNTQVSDVYTFSPNIVNEFRFGYTKQGNWFNPSTLGKGYPQKLGLQYSKADVFPQVSVSQSAIASGAGGSGSVAICCSPILQPGTNAIYIENTFEPSDVVTMIRGKHILHFGGEVLAYQGNLTPWGNVQSGSFSFTGVYTQQNNTTASGGSAYADFLLGDVNSWGATNQPESGMRMKSPQFFVQDDFKVRPNLTVNLGLRYEFQGGWSEVKNHLGAFDPTITNPITNTPGAMWFAGETSRTRLMKSVNDVFLPRVGFAWNLGGGSTVVRGGFGIYAITFSLDDYGQGAGIGNNSTGSASDASGGVGPVTTLGGPGINLQTGQPLPYVVDNRNPGGYNGLNVPYNNYNLRVPTINEWTLSVERQLGKNTVGEIAYVGSHGNHLGYPVDINQIPQNLLQPTFNKANTPYSQFGTISGAVNESKSNYNSMQLQVNHRLTSGLTFNANYVWSHFLDDQDSAGWGGRGGTQVYQNAYSAASNYGNSNFDVRHAVKGSVVYEVPFGKGRHFLNSNAFLDQVIGGWQTSAIWFWHTGQPYTVIAANNNSASENPGGNNESSQFVNVVGDPNPANRTIQNWYNVNAFAQPTAGTFGNEKRNSLFGPRYSEVDFSLGKNFALKEGISLQFRIDAYNIFNHPSFANPNTGESFAANSSGILTPTSAASITSTENGARAFQLDARISF
jgi:Carboxypeptidase regulatory-like domain